jgi:hypothetical protein
MVLAMIVAAVLAYRRRTGYAVGLLAAGTALAMLVGTHLLMDSIIDVRRSQRVFVERLQPHLARLAPGRRLILFGSEQYELTYLLPNRFDFVRWVKDAASVTKALWAIKSRLAAETDPTLVVMTREHWEQIVEANKYYARRYKQSDPWVEKFEEIPLGLGDYDQQHREPLMLLEFRPTTSGSES